MTVRPQLARAASAVLVLGSTLLGAVGAGVAAPTPTPTFDWPLDCPATVVQRYTSPNLDIEVSYEVVIDEATIPEVIAVEFGPATVDEFSGDGAAGVSAEQLAAYFTNPVIEIEADGSPVEAIGFEEWWERFEPIGGGAHDVEVQLEFEVTLRATITWESWAGVWVAMSDFDGEIVVDSSGDDSATFLAERTAGERTTLIELVADPDTLQPEAAHYEVRSLDDDVIISYEWWFDWPACELAQSVADLGGGARRLVTGAGGELYYTDDHYDSFRLVAEP